MSCVHPSFTALIQIESKSMFSTLVSDLNLYVTHPSLRKFAFQTFIILLNIFLQVWTRLSPYLGDSEGLFLKTYLFKSVFWKSPFLCIFINKFSKKFRKFRKIGGSMANSFLRTKTPLKGHFCDSLIKKLHANPAAKKIQFCSSFCNSWKIRTKAFWMHLL